MTTDLTVNVDIPLKLHRVLSGTARYRGAHGGRGSGKSWAFARMLLVRAMQSPIRILCTRELQNSIKASVLQVLIDQVEALGLENFFDHGESFLRGINGSEFIFKGLKHNYREIKSTEGIDICWIEEAETVSEDSFRVLFPTVRKPGSEIWLTWNPESTDSPIQKRFIDTPPENAIVEQVNYLDNPWFPAELEMERVNDQRRDPDLYAHVWEGACLTRTEAQVLAGKWRVATFDRPAAIDGGPYYGCDWGFSSDPLALVCCWVKGNTLYIDREAGGKRIEIKDTPATFDLVHGIRDHIVRADNARPEMISNMQLEGFRVVAAEKWPGSIEDGITHLRSYDEIVIHERCVEVAREARLWSYKIDRLTGDVLPVLIDANNHYFDATRYALAPIIKKPKNTGKAIYAGQFNQAIHVGLEEFWPIKGAPLVIGVAVTASNEPYALIGQVNRSGQLRIIEQVPGDSMGVAQFAKSVLRPLLSSKYRGLSYSMISFRANSSARTQDTDERLIVDELDSAGFSVESVNSNLLGRKLEAVRWFLGQLTNGRPAIVISPTCVDVNDGFLGGYQYKRMVQQDGDELRYTPDPDKNKYVTPHEALQYICMFVRGDMEEAKSQQITVEQRNY